MELAAPLLTLRKNWRSKSVDTVQHCLLLKIRYCTLKETAFSALMCWVFPYTVLFCFSGTVR